MIGVSQWARDPWSLFDDLVSLQSDFNRLFDGERSVAARRSYPLMDAWYADDSLMVDVELPGVEPGTVDISVTGDQLTVSGKVEELKPKEGEKLVRQERPYGQFTRSVTLPFRVEGAKVKAQYRNGILRIMLPRAEADKPQKIAIETA